MSNEMKDWLEEQKKEEAALIDYVNGCPTLLSMLNDIGLSPEQCNLTDSMPDRTVAGSEERDKMLHIARHWQAGLPSRATKWHKCNGTIKQYPKFLCSVCPPGEDIIDFNPIERMKELEEDSDFLYALEACGVDNWCGYDEACNQ